MTTKTTAAQPDPLMQVKMELAAAIEDGRIGALATALQQHPTYAAELTAFYGALLATQGYENVPITPEIELLASRASARAFASVFGAATAQRVPASVATLKALRQARRKSMREVARGLGLGVDVLSALEAGRIRVNSVPQILLQRLSALLDTAAGELQTLLAGPAQAPAFRRSKEGERKDDSARDEMSFDDAVRLSAEMSAEEKSTWLAAK
jgi:transcriptional regulator with XRE-family HTH domain